MSVKQKEIITRHEGTNQFERLVYNRKSSPGFLPVESVDVTVTSAQILALNATPQTMIAAPGAGLAIVFWGALCFLDYNSAAYAEDAGDDLAWKYTDDSGLQVASCDSTGFMTATSDQVRFVNAYTAASGDSAITPVANSPIVLHVLSSELTTGNSPLYVRNYYSVIPASLPYM